MALLLLAWTLRLPPALANRLHPDEALYGYWGLQIGHGGDPWLVGAAVDKPPLWPYLIAGGQALFGDTEFGLRVPGLLAGLLMVPLVAALAGAIYRDRWSPGLAAICAALSPFAILFSGAAFPDALMVTLGVGSCVAAARRRPGWAGLLAGLSGAAKQTGFVWVPLALALAVVQACQHPLRTSRPAHQVGRFLLRFCLVLVPVAAWDAVRVACGAGSFWISGVASFGGLRLIWPHELGPRLRGWARFSYFVFASPVLAGVLVVGLPALVGARIRRAARTQQAFVDLLLVLFSLAYLLVHWMLAFPVWDRYLFPLAPVLAVLVARLVSLLIGRVTPAAVRRSLGVVGQLSLVALLTLPAINAARSRYPVGGDHGAYDGVDQVAAFLCTLPEGAVVYHHWLGWHLRYYLFRAPVYLAYWPAPAWLAQDVRAFGGHEPRYIAFPAWEQPARVLHALAGVGYGLEPVVETVRRDGAPSITVYRITRTGDP